MVITKFIGGAREVEMDAVAKNGKVQSYICLEKKTRFISKLDDKK